jgi:hypothetical protein
LARRINSTVAGVNIDGLRASIRARYTKRLKDRRGPSTMVSARRSGLGSTQPRRFVIEAQALIDAIDRGDDIVIASSYVGGNTFPEGREIPWIADGSVSSIVVSADDIIRPALRGGERRRRD